MNQVSFLLVLLSSAVFLTGCESKDDKIKELTNIQSEIGSKNQINAEKEYLETKAKLMETDLERRQRFYQAVAGIYEGTFQVNQSEFYIRLTLTPSLPRYVPTDRIRTPEEVASDLNSLYFNVQVVQWNPQNILGSVGCLVTNVRPDIIGGRINVVSETCPNLYTFHLADMVGETGHLPNGRAADIAGALTDGRINSVSGLGGRIQLTSNAAVYEFFATRVQE